MPWSSKASTIGSAITPWNPCRRRPRGGRPTSSRPRNSWRQRPVNKGMFCLLFFPFLLPFLVLRFVFRLVFGLLMLPFIMLFVVGAVLFALFSVFFAMFIPLMPFVLIALAIWALTRHSRAASAYPG